MIWRLAICFNVYLCLLSAAVVKGKVSIQETGEKSGKPLGLSDVVVWLEQSEPQAVNTTRVMAVKTRMVQKKKTFSPHVLTIPVGSTVEFPNADPIFHNAFSNYNGEIFDVGLYPPGTTRSVKFKRAGVVRVFCNIHASMSAVILVLKSPWYATSDSNGAFEIENVPEGTYRLSVYYERATEQALSALSRSVTVSPSGEDLGIISLSESGYLAIPHLNKYGKPYPSPGSDPGAYPGARP